MPKQRSFFLLRIVKGIVKRVLPEEYLEAIRVTRTPSWRQENALDDEAMRAIIRSCVLGQSGIMVDVGAHSGDILSAAVEAAPMANHHAFEPGPIAHELARRFPGVAVHMVCVGAHDANVDFFLYKRSTRSSLLLVNDEYLVEILQVEQVSIDKFFEGKTQVSVLKIDVEGQEFEVLKGAVHLLREQSPVLLFEHGSPTGVDSTSTGEIFDLLQSFRYSIAPIRGSIINSRLEFSEIVQKGLAWNFVAVAKS